MTEYFIDGSTFAAPFVGDPVKRFIESETPQAAILKLVDEMKDSTFPLYAANAYHSSDDALKGEKPLAKWRSNRALKNELNEAEGVFI